MHLIISTHFIKAGMVDKAKRRIDANGEGMRQSPGFSFRYRMMAKDDPLKLVSITAWTDESAYLAYRKAARGTNKGADFEGESPYSQIVQEAYVVESESGER